MPSHSPKFHSHLSQSSLTIISQPKKYTPDVKEETINLQNTTLKFTGKSDSKEYALDIEFFKPVDAEGSTYKVLPRSVQMHVMKKKVDDSEEEEFWPRLLKDKALEKNQVSVFVCFWGDFIDGCVYFYKCVRVFFSPLIL